MPGTAGSGGRPDLPALMIAGPGELHEGDLEALSGQVIAHYGDFWTAIHQETLDRLARMLGVEEPPYLIPGTGSTCLDAAVANMFEPGQRVVVPNTGFFGARLIEIAASHRLQVVEVPVEVGAPVDPERVADVLRGADGVLATHVDTSTGVRHPVEAIARVAHEAGAVTVIDGIASVGGELLNVKAAGIQALVTASQKGLEAPPGLGVIALGPRGRDRIEARSRRPESWYLDLERWDWYRSQWSWHPHPVTMPVNLVRALLSSLRRIEATGLRECIGRRADLAKRCREGLRELGLEPVPRAGSEANLVVAAWTDDPSKLQGALLERGIMVSGGLQPTYGKAIRVGLMGRTATPEMVDRVLEGVAEALG
jgi:alanine-glyoxylate transaminase / serine-glyoxylate transaminase / serine-pyruvate transaminase